jgi:hypothetical protein
VAVARARWLPLTLGGKWNPELRRVFHGNSGAYVLRRASSGVVEYAGESHTGRGWKTLQRHFQDRSGAFVDRSEYVRSDPSGYEVAIWVTSKGARPKKHGDQKALDVQAALITRYRPTENRDDGQAFEACPHGTTSQRCAKHHLSPERPSSAPPPAEDDFAFGANVPQEEGGAFGGFGLENPPPGVAAERLASSRTADLFTGKTRGEEGGKARRDWKGEAERLAGELAECRRTPPAAAAPRAPQSVALKRPAGYGETDVKGQASMFKRNPKPKPLVAPAKLKLLASGALDAKEHSALFLALLAAADRATDREIKQTGDRVAADARSDEARAAIREANAAGALARGKLRDVKIAALKEETFVRPGTYEHELAVMRARKDNPPGLVLLGELVSLAYLSRRHAALGRSVQRFFRPRSVLLAYEPSTSRLSLVYAPKVTGRSSAAARKEYGRTHWGKAGAGQALEGDALEGDAPEVGTIKALTYATRKGADPELVNYSHTFGDLGAGRFDPDFTPPVLEGATVGGRQMLRLRGGSYKVTSHGIVG